MTPREIAEKVDEIYTSIAEKVKTIGCTLDMEEATIDSNPTCGTVACHGGFLANHFQTDVSHRAYDNKPSRHFLNGVEQLVEALGFDDFYGLYDYIKPYWHNNSCLFFGGSDIAFNDDGTTTFEDIKNFMIDAFARAAVEEGTE